MSKENKLGFWQYNYVLTLVFVPKIDFYIPVNNVVLKKLKNHLMNVNQDKLQDTQKRFLIKQWITKNKENYGVSQSYLHWKVDRCSYQDLIDRYIDQLNFMAEHTFMASQNYCQFKLAKKKFASWPSSIGAWFCTKIICA